MHLFCCLIMVLLAYPTIAADTGALAKDTTAVSAEAPAPATPQQSLITTRRAELEQRVTAKWDAMIRKDLAAAYSLTSPAYRNLFSLDAFKRNFSLNKVAWKRIEVVSTDFKNDDAATVGIKVYFVYYQPQAEKAAEMTTYIDESWVRVDGQWWYLVKE